MRDGPLPPRPQIPSTLLHPFARSSCPCARNSRLTARRAGPDGYSNGPGTGAVIAPPSLHGPDGAITSENHGGKAYGEALSSLFSALVDSGDAHLQDLG